MNSYHQRAFLYSTIVAMGGFVFGLDAALISGTINFIVQEFSLSEIQLGTAVSAPALGVLFALPFAGYASNILGRKRTLQVIAALYVFSAIASAFAPTFATLVAARFIGGLAFSSITLASMYIGEIAPPQWRGKLVSMIQINIVIGLTGAYFINYVILQSTDSGAAWVEGLGLAQHTWRWMLGAEIIPAIFWFGFIFIIPESPYWYLYKGRVKEARNSLAKVLPEEEIDVQIEEIQESIKKDTSNRTVLSQLKEILGKSMRITFIIACTLAIAQQATGINAILFYAPTVIEQLGIGTDAAFLQTIWIGISSLVFTLLSLALVDKLGRRPLVIWGMIWIISSLGICAYGFYEARYTITEAAMNEMREIPNVERLQPLIGMEFSDDISFKSALKNAIGEENLRDFSNIILQKTAKMNAVLILIGIISFISAFHFSVGPVMWVLFSEIFPASLRGIALPFFALITSITSYLIQQFFPWQLATMGAYAIFLFYASIVAIGLAILYRYLPETKNMTIEEIQHKLQGK